MKADAPTLFVLDGAKALQAAVGRVWGKFAVVQRCQAHKRRNVEAHLPEQHHEELRKRLNAAYHEASETQARTLLKGTITWLRKISPAAVASLEEGWEETLTVVRLRVPELLRKTLATTNPIESAFTPANAFRYRLYSVVAVFASMAKRSNAASRSVASVMPASSQSMSAKPTTSFIFEVHGDHIRLER